VIYEGNACVLAINAVASNTVMRERLLAVGPGLGAIQQRILLVLVAYEDVVLGKRHGFGLELTWGIGFTAGQSHRGDRGDQYDQEAHR